MVNKKRSILDDGTQFECSGATHKPSLSDSVYISEVGQAVVGNVVEKEWNRGGDVIELVR